MLIQVPRPKLKGSRLRVLDLSKNKNRVDCNGIGDMGCKWLSRGDWPLL